MNRPNPAAPLRGLGILLALAFAATAQQPLTLEEALRTVRAQSDETRLIQETRAKLEAQKSELWAGALPSVSAYANAARAHTVMNLGSFPISFGDSAFGGITMSPVFGTTQNAYSYGLQGSQTLFSFSLGRSIQTAGMVIRAQDAANRRSLQELELATLDAFYGVVMAESRLRVIEASMERQQKTAAFLEANFRAGAGARSTLLLTQASLKALIPERIRAERDAATARMSFNRLLGRPIEAPLTLDTNSVLSIALPDVSEPAIAQALERRPDLEALRMQRDALKGYASVYRGQYLPSIGVSGKVGITAFETDEQLTDFDNNLEWQVGVGLTWPLFDGLGNRARARQYDSDARSLAINERRATAQVRIELESARREAAAADTAYLASQQARDAAAEALELISADFRAGSGQVTDLLTAEESLRSAEAALVAARYQNVRARAALRIAMGMNLIETEGETK